MRIFKPYLTLIYFSILMLNTQSVDAQTAICRKKFSISVMAGTCDLTIPATLLDSGSVDYDFLTAENNYLPTLGTYDVKLIASKFNGNSSECISHVKLVDRAAPAPYTKSTLSVVLDSNNEFQILPSHIDNGSWDQCSPVSLSVSPSLITCDMSSPLKVFLIVTDESGNTNSHYTNVTILQNPSRNTNLECRSVTDVEVYRKGSRLLTADMILTGQGYACANYYQFDLINNGLEISDHSVNYGDVGKTYMASVKDNESQTSCQGLIRLVKAACDSTLYVCDTKSKCKAAGQCDSGHTLADDVEWPCDIDLNNVPFVIYNNPNIENIALLMGVQVTELQPIFDVSECVILGENITENEYFEAVGIKVIRRKYSYINWADPGSAEVSYTQTIRLRLTSNLNCDICDTKAWNTAVGNCASGHTLEDGVEWPADITIHTTLASPFDLSTNPEVNANDVSPQISANCNILSMNYNDFIDSLGPSQYKISRHWEVVNWSNNFVSAYRQIIHVDAGISTQRKVCFTDMHDIPIVDVDVWNGFNTGNDNCVYFQHNESMGEILPVKVELDVFKGIDVEDAVLFAESLLLNGTYEIYRYEQMDLNGDFAINNHDLEIVKDFCIKKNSANLSSEPWLFFGANNYKYKGNQYVKGLPHSSPFESLQFTGIKAGDFNFDALSQKLPLDKVDFNADDFLLYKDEKYSIPIKNEETLKIKGIQFALSKEDEFVLDSIKSDFFNDITINELDSTYSVLCLAPNEDLLQGGVTIDSGVEIFKLHITSKANTVLSKVLFVQDESALIVSSERKLKPGISFDETIPTSTEDMESEILLFPNPASNMITLQLPGNFVASGIKIFDIQGTMIYESLKPMDRSISVESFSPGIFLIEANSTNGERRIGKFIKL